MFQCCSFNSSFLLLLPLCQQSVLYVYISTDALEKGSSVPSFWIPYICVNICLFFWLASLCIIGSRFIHLIRTNSNALLNLSYWGSSCWIELNHHLLLINIKWYVWHFRVYKVFSHEHTCFSHVLSIISSGLATQSWSRDQQHQWTWVLGRNTASQTPALRLI